MDNVIWFLIGMNVGAIGLAFALGFGFFAGLNHFGPKMVDQTVKRARAWEAEQKARAE